MEFLKELHLNEFFECSLKVTFLILIHKRWIGESEGMGMH